jgi:hypothetical protein
VNTTKARASASVSLRIECGAPPENLAVLLREPFRALTDEHMVRLAAHGHPEVRAAHGAPSSSSSTTPGRVRACSPTARG